MFTSGYDSAINLLILLYKLGIDTADMYQHDIDEFVEKMETKMYER
jgi:hypothetical protein